MYFKIVRKENDKLVSVSEHLPPHYLVEYEKDKEALPYENSKLFVFCSLAACKDYFENQCEIHIEYEIWSCDATHPIKREYIPYPSQCDTYWKHHEWEIGVEYTYTLLLVFRDCEKQVAIRTPTGALLVESVTLREKVSL